MGWVDLSSLAALCASRRKKIKIKNCGVSGKPHGSHGSRVKTMLRTRTTQLGRGMARDGSGWTGDYGDQNTHDSIVMCCQDGHNKSSS